MIAAIEKSVNHCVKIVAFVAMEHYFMISNWLVLQPVSSYPTNRSSFPKSFIGNPYSAIDFR